jgi:acyl-coenzyme A synthetase/AMP-(fatty) acid ligase
MTCLTITEDPGGEFVLRGHNASTDEDEDAILFYEDVIGVHVVPEPDGFTIQVLTAESVIEMDFEDADKVREALVLFEAKKVLEVDFDVPNSVRIMPPRPEATVA